MKSRLLSGKVKKLTGTRLDGTRYEYLALGQAEPDLGAPTDDGSVLISLASGQRSWSNVLVVSTVTSSVVINSLIASDSTTTGALIVNGGVGIGQNLNVGGTITARTLNITTTSYIANAQILTTATVNDFVTVIPNQIYQNTSSVRVIDNLDSGVEPQVLITVAGIDTIAYYSTLTEFLQKPVVIQGNHLKNFTGIEGNTLQVYGGLGAEQLYVSGTAYLGGAEILTTQTGLSSELGSILARLTEVLTTTTNAVSTQTGALIVKGGVGIGKDVYIGGTLVFENGGRVVTNQIEVKSTGTNTATNTGILLINGGIVTVTTTTNSTSSTTGAFTVVGGVGIGGNLTVAGTATFGAIGGIVNVVSTAISTSSTTGALRVAGGVGIQGNLNVDGTITANQLTIQYTTITTTIVETDDIIKTFNATNSTGTTTGALTVAGGVGIGADLYVGGRVFSQSAEVLTTASVNQYANQTTITAGTDTEVSTSTGDIVIWNTSTLQTITDRGNTTTNTIRITNSSSRALYVEGGVYIGGDLELKGSLVVTSATINAYVAGTVINAGTDTAVSTVGTTGTNVFYIWNTSTLQSITDRGNSTTNAIQILNTASSTTTGTGALVVGGGIYVAKDSRFDGNLYLKGSLVLTSATLNSYVSTTIINAGTDTAVSSIITTSSNIFYVWNTSTFQTTTDRGNSTTNSIIILNTSGSALTVGGGAAFGSTITVDPIPWNYLAVTYTAIPVTYGQTGLTFTVQPDNTITDISVAYGAGGYGPDTVDLTIPGTTFPGGTSPANDIIFTVQTFEYPGPVYVTQTNSAVIYADGTPPSRYDTVYSLGDVGIGAGNQHWVFGTDGKLTTPGNIVILSTESSISATTGALTVSGGIGIGGNVNIAGGLVASGINLLNQNQHIWYVDPVIGVDDYTKNGHPLAPAKTIKYILGYADSGDTVFIQPGIYYEEFPLTIAKGVSVRGAGLREVTIYPTTATNTSTAFLLNGEALISDFTVGGFFKPGYAFEFAPGAVTTNKSPYIERLSVITKGSVTSAGDPNGFDSNDAGNGAKIDGSQVATTSSQASMMFNEATFIVPNATGLYMTNGARAEVINTFFYFADKAINAVSGTVGYGGAGKTKLKLGNVTTGTFTAGDTITYRSSTGTTLASGTIASVDGSYVYINGASWGFETPVSKTPKITTAYGTAALSTAQKKFGSSSLYFDGSAGGAALTPTSTDFNFGTGNFTIEFWVYRVGSATNQILFDMRPVTTSDVALTISLASNVIGYYSANTLRITGPTLSANTWYNIAVSRVSGTTRLFVNGTQAGSSYTDANNYIQGPVRLGLSVLGGNPFNGYIDDVRVSNVGRYTTTVTTSSSLVSDASTVLMLHLNGSSGSTVFTDDSYIVTQDIRSTGASPAAASSLVLADYHQFGAEIRSIGSAAIFGNSGVTANGTGTDIKLIAFNLSHIGAGKDSTDDISLVVQANEVIQLNGGKVYYQTVDQSGDFRVGSSFVVNQRTGNVSFGTAQIDLTNIGQLTVTDGVNSTLILPTSIGVGSLVLSGGSLITQSGNLTLDPAGTLTTINSDLDVNGAITVASSTNSTSTDTGAVVIDGGVGIAKDVFIGGDVHVLSTTNSTATTNGAVSILGGIGIVKDLWVGGIIYSAGQAVVTTSTVDAALNQTLQSITDKGFTTTNRINITNETNSTSTDTGALTVFGGVGIGHDLWVGGRIMSDNSQVITVTTVDQFAATEIRAGTDTAVSSSTGVITVWNTSTLQSITNRGNSTTNAIIISNTQSSTGTVTANALFVAGGVGINGTLLVQGKAVFRDDVLFIGSSTSIFSTNTYYTDNLIELHTPPAGPSVPWTLSDGQDIGFRFHYYDVFTGDQNAALVLDPYTKNLEWYSTGAEDAAGNFSSATYGTFKTGEIVIANTTPTFGTNSGALRVVGGVGIGGDLYVGGNIIGLATTASTFFGTAVAARNIAGGKPNLIPYQGTTSTTNFDDNLRWLPETSTLAIGTTSSGSITVVQDVTIGNILNVNRIRAIDTSSLYFNANGIYNTGTSTSTHYWSFNNDGTTSFPGYKFPAGDGPYGYALVTNGTGTVNWSPVLSYVGSVGFTGSSSGFTGSTGYWGSRGDLGYTGSIGYAGSMGVGYTGSSSGYIGSTGYAGSIGYTGSIGIGYTGSTSGYIGSTGYTGSSGAGYTGSSGAGYTGSMGYSGSQGPRGADGTSVRILGSVSTYTALPGYPNSYGGSIGDGYITLDTGHLWVWNGSTWIDAGNITGPQGTIGYSGSKGAGFTGSVGTLGYTGSIGYQGSKGALDPWVKIVANYTAVNNQRIIADTSAGQFTIALPDSPFIGSYLIVTDGASWKDTPLLITAGAYTIEGYGDTLVVDITGITCEFIWSGSTWQVTATLGIRGAAGYTGSYGGFAAVGYTGSQADLSAISTNILPVTSGTYALGAVNKGWTSVYANFAYIGSNSYVGNETADSLTVNKTLVINTNTIYLGGNTLNINAQGTLLLNGGQVGISAVQATALAAAMSVVMGM